MRARQAGYGLSPVFLGRLQSEFLAQCSDIVEVNISKLITGVEWNHMLRRYAPYGMPIDCPVTLKRSSREDSVIFDRSADSVARFVEYNYMEVEFAPVVVPEDGIPPACVGTRDVSVSTPDQQGDSYVHILLLNGEIEVTVGACLFAEERIDTPSAVDPYLDSSFFKFGVEIDDVHRGHLFYGSRFC
jgi:hypothetical protein